MKLLFLNIIRTLIAVPFIIILTIIFYFSMKTTFLLSLIYAILSTAIVYFTVTIGVNYYLMKKHSLTLKEYLFIKRNLRDANKKMNRLYKSLMSVHHLPSLKQRIKLIRTVRRIFKITKKEPKRFFKGEMFFYSHLDSIVELMEKFVFLAGQPNKTTDINVTLSETQRTLEKLTKTIEQDLHKIIEDDIDDLNFEIDVANYKYRNKTNSFFESRR